MSKTNVNSIVVNVTNGDSTKTHEVLIDFTPSQCRAIQEACDDLMGGEVSSVRLATFFRPTRDRSGVDKGVVKEKALAGTTSK